MMILLYFKFTRTLAFTICPTVMLNIAWDIINKVFREELYWCTAANPNFDSENRSSGPETGQQNMNAMKQMMNYTTWYWTEVENR